MSREKPFSGDAPKYFSSEKPRKKGIVRRGLEKTALMTGLVGSAAFMAPEKAQQVASYAELQYRKLSHEIKKSPEKIEEIQRELREIFESGSLPSAEQRKNFHRRYEEAHGISPERGQQFDQFIEELVERLNEMNGNPTNLQDQKRWLFELMNSLGRTGNSESFVTSVCDPKDDVTNCQARFNIVPMIVPRVDPSMAMQGQGQGDHERILVTLSDGNQYALEPGEIPALVTPESLAGSVLVPVDCHLMDLAGFDYRDQVEKHLFSKPSDEPREKNFLLEDADSIFPSGSFLSPGERKLLTFETPEAGESLEAFRARRRRSFEDVLRRNQLHESISVSLVSEGIREEEPDGEPNGDGESLYRYSIDKYVGESLGHLNKNIVNFSIRQRKGKINIDQLVAEIQNEGIKIGGIGYSAGTPNKDATKLRKLIDSGNADSIALIIPQGVSEILSVVDGLDGFADGLIFLPDTIPKTEEEAEALTKCLVPGSNNNIHIYGIDKKTGQPRVIEVPLTAGKVILADLQEAASKLNP